MAAKGNGSTPPSEPAVYNSPDVPFGGYERSGLGREHGVDGFREFLQSKTIASPAP